RSIEEADQVLAAARLLQLAHRLGFDLADSLAGDLEDVPHLFECVAVTIAQAVTQLDDLALAVGEALEDVGDAVFQHLLRRSDLRALGGAVGQQVAELAVFTVADRAVERNRETAHRQHAPRFFDRGVGPPRGFFDRRFAAEFLQQLPGDVPYPAHRFDHVHRNADGAALVGHRAGDRLANPPGRVGT